MDTRGIRKVVMTVFCWEDEAQPVRDSLAEWFGDNEHALFGAAPIVVEPTPEEETEARDNLDDGLGAELDE